MSKKENTSEQELPLEQEDTLAAEVAEHFDLDKFIVDDGDGYGVPDAPKEELKAKPKKKEEELSNDEKRFQYFQSQYDKERNRNAELERQVAALAQAQAQMAGAQAAKQEEKVNETPKLEAPERPKKPSYFSKEEAMTDPRSDSAKYLESLDEWRDEMTIHNQKLVQETARLNEAKIAEIKESVLAETQKAKVADEQRQKLMELSNTLKSKFGATDEQVVGFVKEMSQEQSITVDNLWQLYSIKHGIDPNSMTQHNIKIGDLKPSDDFKQAERAQAIPNALGVLPGKQSLPKKSDVDLIVDKMLEMQGNEDPWS